ncbi:hypothetical protein SUGI_0207090 [Cryptomeria japonica]|nr:hypothetical protein SUGI_0207090 [Cryptomeria japonica]
MTSLMAILAFRQAVVQALMQAYATLPLEVQVAFNRFRHRILSWFSAYTYFEIMDVYGVNTNELHSDVHLHLSNSPSISTTRITRAKNSSSFPSVLLTMLSLMTNTMEFPSGGSTE